MAMKLFDLIEQWFGDILSKNINDKAINAVSNKMGELGQIDNVIDQLNIQLKSARQSLENYKKTLSETAPEVVDARKNINDLIEALKQENKFREQIVKDLTKQTNLTTNEIDELIDKIKEFGVETVKSAKSTEKIKDTISKMSNVLGFDLKNLSKEFFTLSGILVATTEQIAKSNKQLVEYSRRVGGAMNYRTLGFDATGNNMTNTGSLASITATNNISEEQFFEALGGFAKGKVIGQDYSKSASDLQRFAVEQGRLIKLYGVASGDVAKITEVSTQLYGVSIKQLNKEFTDGARIAKTAGLNVQEYFKNLARASEMIGETYIQGGTKGLEKLALFATQLNTSVDNLVRVGNNFKNISDIFEQQGKGTNLGLNNYANQAANLFAKTQLGLYEEANKIAITALAKDVQKYTDKNGIIDQRGIRALNEMGFDKEYIQVIQRTIQAQKKLGVSFEELTDINKLSTKKQLEYYEEMSNSATLTEKLNNLWAKVKAVFLDPVASVLGPALRIVIDSLTIAFQLLYVALKPFIYAFQLIGTQLTKISNKISAISGFIEEKLRNIGISGEKFGKMFDKLADVGGSLIAAFLALRGAAYASAAAQTLGGKFGNLGGNIGKLLGGSGRFAAMGRLAGMRLGGLAGGIGRMAPKLLRGGGIALAGGLVGDAISSLGPEGGIADRLGSAVSWGSTGAAIGSIIPGIGPAIGAAIGGLIGAFKNEIGQGILNLGGWLKKIFGPVSYLIPIFNTFVLVKDMWDKYFGDSKEEEAKKIANQSYDTGNIYSMLNSTLAQRVIDPLKAEKAQEKLVDKISRPQIVVQNGIGMGDVKAKISGY